MSKCHMSRMKCVDSVSRAKKCSNSRIRDRKRALLDYDLLAVIDVETCSGGFLAQATAIEGVPDAGSACSIVELLDGGCLLVEVEDEGLDVAAFCWEIQYEVCAEGTDGDI